VLTLVTAAAAVAVAAAPGNPLPRAPRCPAVPAGFTLDRRVDHLPVAPDSDRMVAAIGAGSPMHADFGSGLYEGRAIGIPFDVVSKRTPRSRVRFDYADESDRVRYPIPAGVHIEGGGDRHALLVDRDACKLYELYALERKGSGWSAGSGAVWDLRRPRPRRAGWTSADAAGLPILPLLARYDEARGGHIGHALRITVPRTRNGYVFPARHSASSDGDPALPRMGERLRLKASVELGRFPPQARAVLRALREYGGIVADNGSAWFVSGAPDRHWDNDQLATLRRISGSDFEVVRVTRRQRRVVHGGTAPRAARAHLTGRAASCLIIDRAARRVRPAPRRSAEAARQALGTRCRLVDRLHRSPISAAHRGARRPEG
jgi:hypothetical protein